MDSQVQLVLQFINDNDGCTLNDIIEGTKLSEDIVSAITDALINDNLSDYELEDK